MRPVLPQKAKLINTARKPQILISINTDKNTSVSNSAAYYRDYNSWSREIYPWNTRMVQHKETNEYKILHEKNKGGKKNWPFQLMQKKNLMQLNIFFLRKKKTVNKLGTKRKLSQHNKSHLRKTTMNIIPRLKASTQKSEQGCLPITLLFNLVLQIIHRTMKQGKWKGPKLKRKKKNYLCTDDVICKTNPKDSTSLLLQIKQNTRSQSTHKN